MAFNKASDWAPVLHGSAGGTFLKTAAGVKILLRFLILDGEAGVRRLRKLPASFILKLVLEGRRIAFGASQKRKVRTPPGAMLRNPGLFDWDTRRRKVGRLFDGKCHRKLNRLNCSGAL